MGRVKGTAISRFAIGGQSPAFSSAGSAQWSLDGGLFKIGVFFRSLFFELPAGAAGRRPRTGLTDFFFSRAALSAACCASF